MKDTKKTREQLLEEVHVLRQKLAKKNSQSEVSFEKDNKHDYRKIFTKATQEGIAIHKDGIFLEVNDRFTTIFGYTSSELNGMQVDNLVAPDWRKKVANNIKSGFEGFYEHLALKKDGTVFPVEAKGTMISTNGETIRVTVIRDLLKRKEVEEGLIKIEHRFSDLFENMRDGWVSIDLEGKIQSCNRAFEEIVGYTLKELQNTDFHEITPQKYHAFEENILEKIIKEGNSGIYEKEYIRKDGTLVDIEIIAYQQKNSDGNHEGFWGMVRDTSERKKKEEKLNLFSKFVESSGQGFGIGTLDGKILYMNPKMLEIDGIDSLKDVVGQSFFPFIPEELHQKMQEEVLPIVMKIGRWEGEMAIKTTNGEVIPTSETLFTIKDENGQPIYLAVIISDISEKKKAEEQIGIFKKFAESSNQGMAIGTFNGEILYANQAICNLIGLKNSSAVIGKSFLPFYPKDIQEKFGRTIIPVLHNEGKWSGELKLIPQGGNILDTYEDYFTINDDKGNPLYLATIITDITEKKKAEQELIQHRNHLEELVHERTNDLETSNKKLLTEIEDRKKIENKLRDEIGFSKNLIDSMPSIFYMLDTEGNMVRWNEKFEFTTGYSQEEISTMNGLDFFSKKESEKVALAIQEVFQKGRSSVEADLLSKKGSITPFYFTGIRYESKGKLGLMGVGMDVSERKNTELELFKSRQQLAYHIDQTPLAVIEWDLEFKVKSWNQSAEKIFGYREKDAIGQHASFIVQDVNEKHVNTVWQSLLENSGGTRASNSNITQEGKEIICEWYNTPLINDEGDVVGVASMVQDITTRKKNEAEILQKRDDIETLNKLNEAVNRGDSLQDILYMASDLTKGMFSGFGAAIYLLDKNRENLVLQTTKQLEGATKKIEKLTGWKFSGVRIPSNSEHCFFTIIEEKRLKISEGKDEIIKVYKDFGEAMGFKGKLAEKMTGFTLSKIYKILNLKSIVTAPLIVENECIGILDIGTSSTFSESDIERIKGLTGQLTAIIKRKMAEEKLRDVNRQLKESNLFNETILETTPDVIYVYDLIERKNVFVNEGIQRNLGYSEKEIKVMGANLIPELMHPDDFKTYLDQTIPKYTHLKDQKILTHEYRMRHKKGDWRWLYCKELIFNRLPDGSPHQIFGVVQDITDRKQVEEEIARSEENLRRAQEVAHIGSWIWHTDNNKIEMSEELYNILGLKVEDGIPPVDTEGKMIHPEDRGLLRENITKCLTEKIPYSLDYRIIRQDNGDLRYLHVETEIEEKSGSDDFLIRGTVQDITERKDAEEKIKNTLHELERSNTELEQFAYVSSHDLQEPLRKVKSFTELLALKYKGKLDEKADHYMSYITDGATRMQTLITDLLSYSRVSTRGKSFEKIKLEKVVELALENLQLFIQENNAEIQMDSLPVTKMDETQMVQVFQNLIGNAIKFRKKEESPKIHIGSKKEKNEWVISVTDNGIGMDMRYAEKIFVVFQRLHTKEEYPGTGIGLSLCKKIIERHGGRIWLESKPGKGTTFYFSIPK